MNLRFCDGIKKKMSIKIYIVLFFKNCAIQKSLSLSGMPTVYPENSLAAERLLTQIC